MICSTLQARSKLNIARPEITLPHGPRNVHAEHAEIFELAMARQDARAALALEGHIRTTPDQLVATMRDGLFMPRRDEAERSRAVVPIAMQAASDSRG